uniref:Uncharacterized protein n=1 Tax=Cebus imitator TaxID=2715852 RepID=A0A2K5QK68_CEBIM
MPEVPSWELTHSQASGTPWGRLDPRGLPLSPYPTLAHTPSFLPGGPDDGSELPSGPLPIFSGLPPLPEREPMYSLPSSRMLWPCRPACAWNSIFPHLMGTR